ncbi:hypothetical protein [Archangium sp.]|uniref:hypothetical protein n=1 Tax=Archangium sp. TaxID=1872627 RepID=UPI002D70B5A2|nr:hypothetical protein [Archangium sp.]HYO52186.1 hypothetical protein [Archangium sp.]
MSVEEVRPLLAAFASLQPLPRPRLRLLEVPDADLSGRGPASTWELRLREEFLSRLGPPLLPLPESLESSRLAFALQRSPRYMGEGFREAAQELFNSPAFVLSVSLSIAVYFAAWLVPEPLFSKAFAAALTVRLSLLVGLVELSHLALACLSLYQEAEAASTPQELEAVAERFGKSMGGTTLRVLLVVASMGLARLVPQVPEGGIWSLLGPARITPEGQVILESVAAAQAVADGSLIITGVAAGTACGGLALCASNAAGEPSGGGAKLSTRYGKPHTRKNPPHNEAIEEELARREAAGHIDLRKNKAQVTAKRRGVEDPEPVKGIRFRKPDVSSVRPDGIRHNTNYVSNHQDLKRELEAFDSMMRADPRAIHELYLLDGTLVRRYVPPGVSFP